MKKVTFLSMKLGLALPLVLLAAPAFAQEGPPVVEVVETEPNALSGRYDKGFVLRTADDQFTLKLNSRLQPRWEMFVRDDGDKEIEHRMFIARWRLQLDGRAWGSTGYKFEIDVGRGFITLKDAFIEQPIGGVRLRVGNMKRPMSRQALASDRDLQFVDRSITDGFAGGGHDFGVMLHNEYDKGPTGIEWALGVFNGTGDRARIACTTSMAGATTCALPSNVPTDVGPMVGARIGFNTAGVRGYDESDLEGGPLRLSVGASYLGELAEGESDAMLHRLGVDAIVKVAGLSVSGAFFLLNSMAGTERENDIAFHVQGGFVVLPKRLELSARFAQVPAGANDTQEILGAANIFLHGHWLKLAIDAGALRTTGDGGTTDIVARTQFQIQI